jgi:CheY-like chemotaxis protein
LEEPSKIQRRRILLVDDHDINRELGAVLLTPLGHEVVLAASGDEAVKLVQREAFDLIFMDVQMPGMDGFAATRAIRAMDVGNSVPIVALTAHAMRQQIDECLRAGMDGHVAKPFTVETLQRAVDKWATPNDFESPSAPGAAGVSLEMQEFRRRFIARAAEDSAEIERFIAAPSVATEERARSVVHKLAGTAGSLGFHDAGQVALAIDA